MAPFIQRFYRIGVALVFPVCAALACAGNGQYTSKDLSPDGPAPSEIEFFDSSRFDSRLSASLKSGHKEVSAKMLGPVSVNNIPERMDRWFFMIEKNGGKVELQPTGPKPKGFVSDIIELTVGAYNAIKEKIIYDPVKQYDAKVYYNPESANIEQVVFVQKASEDVAP